MKPSVLHRAAAWRMSVAVAWLGLSAGYAMAQKADETFGCEPNPTGSPVGGREGYRKILTTGDFVVRNADELLAALRAATPGKVVYVPDGVEIDLTAHDKVQLPRGVMLAGSRGANGSKGARIFSNSRKTTLLVTAGDDVRVTGLRFEGALGDIEPTVDSGPSVTFLATSHVGVEIDNCEISKWNYRGIAGLPGVFDLHIHHNYIHHCRSGGYGYGVVLIGCDARIIANKFDYCRHAIAGRGDPGCSYEAAYNLVLPNGTQADFDMHGGADRGDGTDIAGDWMDIHHNTFMNERKYAVYIRGVPSQRATVHHNWFVKPSAEAVCTYYVRNRPGALRMYRNVCGPKKTLEE